MLVVHLRVDTRSTTGSILSVEMTHYTTGCIPAALGR
jgi:hypothetical protein